jgi:hypothetical protein
LYQQAFHAARDEDQVNIATEKLKALGRPPDLSRHYGFIMTWKLIGPFDNSGQKGFANTYPPEENVDFAATHIGKNGNVKWIEYTTQDEYGNVDLNAAIGKHMGAVVYAAAEFFSEAPRPIELRLGTVNANKIWLNGKLLHSAEVYHALSKLDQYIGRGELQAGRNLILIKICQNERTETWAQVWKFQFRVCDKIGTAVWSTDRRPPSKES